MQAMTWLSYLPPLGESCDPTFCHSSHARMMLCSASQILFSNALDSEHALLPHLALPPVPYSIPAPDPGTTHNFHLIQPAQPSQAPISLTQSTQTQAGHLLPARLHGMSIFTEAPVNAMSECIEPSHRPPPLQIIHVSDAGRSDRVWSCILPRPLQAMMHQQHAVIPGLGLEVWAWSLLSPASAQDTPTR